MFRKSIFCLRNSVVALLSRKTSVFGNNGLVAGGRSCINFQNDAEQAWIWDSVDGVGTRLPPGWSDVRSPRRTRDFCPL